MTYTAEQFIKSERFMEITTEEAVKTIAKANGQTIDATRRALDLATPNVVKEYVKLIMAAARKCAEEANANYRT